MKSTRWVITTNIEIQENLKMIGREINAMLVLEDVKWCLGKKV